MRTGASWPTCTDQVEVTRPPDHTATNQGCDVKTGRYNARRGTETDD